MIRLALTAALVPAALVLAGPASAQQLASPGTKVLADASDKALTKLAQPGAFQADDAIRIALPGPLRKAGGLMKLTDQANLTSGLSKSLNDAAGLAANEAKPIFRSAISRMTVKGGVGVLSSGTGGTQYLRDTAGPDLRTKVRPLIVAALGRTGAFALLDRMGSGSKRLGDIGISRDGLSDSVTDQALDGIYTYIGAEERGLRANPLGNAKNLLGRFKP